jgi:hypothetical protein
MSTAASMRPAPWTFAAPWGARAPDTVEGLVLIDPALPVPSPISDRQVGTQFLLYALPGPGELYVRAVMSRSPRRSRWPPNASARNTPAPPPSWPLRGP